MGRESKIMSASKVSRLLQTCFSSHFLQKVFWSRSEKGEKIVLNSNGYQMSKVNLKMWWIIEYKVCASHSKQIF